MEGAALLSALERSDGAKLDHWGRRHMVRGDSHPGRGRGLAEDNNKRYSWRMDAPPPDVVAAMMRQVAQEREGGQQSAAGTACTALNTAEDDCTHQMQLECAAGALCHEECGRVSQYVLPN